MTSSKFKVRANKLKILFLFLISINGGIFGQSNNEIKNLLTEIGEQTLNSKEIKDHKSAKQIMNYGAEIIPKLLKSFENKQIAKTYSDCQNRNLTIGEIAIILVDRIEPMPYATVTGVQNCTMQFCKNNDNLIEYYFWWTELRTYDEFVKKYSNWFSSDDREKWVTSLVKKEPKIKTECNKKLHINTSHSLRTVCSFSVPHH